MPARLSSLLVRDGIVGVKRMEKAFQRQVIYGGSVDTILLEMNLVPEERLTQYLALASGLPPAAREEGAHLDPEAVALLAREHAEQFHAVPVAIDGEAVRVLVCSPLQLSALEDLADLLDRPIQPLITPEYRWHLVYARAYDLDAPARFTTLARSLDVDSTVAPVGRAKTVIVEDVRNAPVPIATDLTEKTEPPVTAPVLTPPAPASLARAAASRDAEPLVPLPPVLPVAPVVEEPHRARTSTVIGVQPNRASTETGGARGWRPSLVPPTAPLPPEPTQPVISFVTPSSGVPMATADAGDRTSRPIFDRVSGMRALKRPATAPIDTEGRDAPLTIVAARELLATADDRDTIFLTLLRATRSRARWAGLLTVQGGAAIGRVALAEPGLDTRAIETVLIPLDAVSPFRTVVSNHQPHIGPLISGDPGIDAMVLRLGGTMPPSALLLPIVIRERVVAIVVAHRVHSDIRLADVTELLPIATAASDAITRLIVRGKVRASTEQPVVAIEGENETVPIARRPSRPSGPAFEQGTELSIDAEPPRPIDQLLDLIEHAPEGTTADALAEAAERAKETIAALMKRFPGKLRVERFSVAGRPLRAAQYGGLLELVIQLGTNASELLIEKMGAPQRDVRFYATVCTAELRPRNAVFALAERLFDQDYGVRACAIEALAGYPIQDLGHALIRARRAVHSTDPEVVSAATAAIVELGDTDAIPDLIGVIERADRAGEHARRALIALTAQDFGPSEKKWRKWYDSARGRHRVEWLIEGLAHKEDAVREIAIRDLRRLTGEYFGYHYDLPKREREAAAERWAAWWRDAGQRRFTLPREDERMRPTGIVPIRHEP